MPPRYAFTIDVEEWFHVENLSHLIPPSAWPEQESRLEAQMDRIFALLDEFDTKATFFVLGAAVESRPGIVRAIVDGGHELACHGWSHELIYRQTPEVFRQETVRAKSFLEDASGVEVRGYRASTFSIVDRTRWALDVLAGAGLFTTRPSRPCVTTAMAFRIFRRIRSDWRRRTASCLRRRLRLAACLARAFRSAAVSCVCCRRGGRCVSYAMAR